MRHLELALFNSPLGLLTVTMALGCGSSSGTVAETTDAVTVGDTTRSGAGKTFGALCTSSSECLTGLCVVNDLAPFGWCSKECSPAKEPCEADSAGSFGGWCAEMPSGFEGQPRQLCLPVCKDLFECKSKADLWEECEVPSYKGNPIYGDVTDIRACQAPSSHGKKPVDPTTCEGWEESHGQDFQSEVNVCRSYCEYLLACKEIPFPETFKVECCAFGCLVEMTSEGVVNTTYRKDKKCYVQNFFSFEGTPKVCTQPLEDCGQSPEDPTPRG